MRQQYTVIGLGIVSLPSRFVLRISSIAALFVCITLPFSGCGGGPQTPTPEAVTITAQPVSQTVPIGETATFSVTALGTGPLSYQWGENGVEIAGATSTSYTTPAVALGSGGSTAIGSFQVTVSNASSSVTSNAATLTAGPRSPKAGDVRYLLFQQVSLPGLLDDGGLESGVQAGGGDNSTSIWIGNVAGTPLKLGSTDICGPGIQYQCVWAFDAFNLPPPMTGLAMYYKGGEYSNFESDLQSIAAANVVFKSFDLEPANDAYAVSWVQTAQPGGFDYKLEVVPPAQISATAAADGAASRVITAASFDASGNANLISYGWTGDTTTKYETQATVAQNGGVCSAATAMANDGYVISAFGGNDTDGYLLIGMRVVGDSLPRSVNDTYADEPPYFTPTVYLNGPDGFSSNCYINEQ